MLRKLLANKKIMIVAAALLLTLCVGILILVTPNTKKTGGENPGSTTEQSKEDADSQNDKEKEGTGLEVLKPDEIVPEDSSDASGSWHNTSGSNAQTDNTDKTDEPEQPENNNPNGEDKEDDSNVPEKDKDILKDDVHWEGNFY